MYHLFVIINTLCYIVNVDKIEEREKMWAKFNDEVKSVTCCLIVVSLFTLGSVLIEFNLINLIYLIFINYCTIKYIYIKIIN